MAATLDHKKASVGDVLEAELALLLRVARRLSGNETDAEDLVSQVIVKAIQAWDSFDGRYPRSWLIRILNNEWLQTIRKRKVRQEVSQPEDEEISDDGFWKGIDAQLEATSILKALDRIPEEYRIAVTLCDIEEMSYEEAALTLDVPLGTIRSRLFRGRKMLRARLTGMENTR
jgi:RNA polymerase sigma-70 factor (ECF subfamily)